MTDAVQTWTPEALEALGGEFEEKTPQETAAWAVETFHPDLALACSFGGPGGVALVDMLVKIQPDIRVFYIDTEFLFPETYETRDRLIERYGIRPAAYRAALNPSDVTAHNGFGATLIFSGRPDDAIPHFKNALRLNPRDP